MLGQRNRYDKNSIIETIMIGSLFMVNGFGHLYAFGLVGIVL